MDIIVVRHGIALDADTAEGMGLCDADRPLTSHGVQATQAAAAGLRELLVDRPVDHILTSPLLRARQTAEILARQLGDTLVDQADLLAPPVDMQALDTSLRPYFRQHRLILVGHEPDLASWVSWSLTRRRDRVLAFQCAGAALLKFPGTPEGGTGALRWLVTGEQLQRLG